MGAESHIDLVDIVHLESLPVSSMAEETQPLQPQQAPPTQPQQAPPQNAIMAVGSNLKGFALNVLKEVRRVSRQPPACRAI